MSGLFPDKQVIGWELALTSLQMDIPVMLLYVVESKGSSPGRQGFFMVVNERGAMEGSIGGGIMEHKFMELVLEQLQRKEVVLSLRRQVHDKDAVRDQSGMICSGEQTILLYSFRLEDIAVIRNIKTCLEEYRNGTVQFSPAGMRYLPENPSHDFSFYKRSETDWGYEEKVGYKQRLFIIGGGHCALALSRIMRMMDFHISVYDHRHSLVTLERNEFAHEKILLDEYEELRERVPVMGNNRFIVVMTLGYRTDDRAVRALWDKEFRYFGLLGSRAKVERLWAMYRAEGIAEKVLRKIHAPAGFAIKSQTPEEIAVSIAAEIIQVRNRDRP
jgi:xanthine dehydrogenase accessory factor